VGGNLGVIWLSRDARVLAYSLARATTPSDGLAAYEMARRETVNTIVLACRDMPAAAELAAFEDAYRATTLLDAAVLNARASFTP
jgi:hypothetical protein